MITVKHIAADGKVRRTFENVSNMQTHQGSSVVSVLRTYISAVRDTEAGIPLRDTYGWPVQEAVAHINLAPGESLEVVDEPTRS